MKTRKKTGKTEVQAAAPPTRARNLVTWGLAGIWLFLVAFGAVSMINPPWLQTLSRPGIEVEARAYKDFGDKFFRQGRYRESIDQYLRALEIRPGYVPALVNLAIARGQAGDPAAGVDSLKKALSDEAVHPGTICFNIAQLLEAQGHVEEAAEYYRRTLGTEVEESLVYRKLGALQLQGGALEAARNSFEAALAGQLDPAVHYRQMLQQALQVFADDPENCKAIEDELARGLDLDRLEASYDLDLIRRMQGSDRELAKTHNHLGVLYGRLGALDRAIGHFQASAGIWPGNETAVRNILLLEQMRDERLAAGAPSR